MTRDLVLEENTYTLNDKPSINKACKLVLIKFWKNDLSSRYMPP